MDDAPLTPAHWKLFAVLVIALIVDVMKPATLGFIIPGVMAEYGLSKATVALLPLVALTGTVIGSIVWGMLGDLIGRRASILLAAMMFIGTSICGAMPTFMGNVVMCFLMGISAGGLLPIAFALLVETVPVRQRGGLIVLLGGIGTVGGYLTASGVAWGLVNFGFLLWLPSNLRELGLSPAAAQTLLAKSALIAFPGAILAAWLYQRWSSKNSLVLFTLLTATALFGFTFLESGIENADGVLTALVVTLLISSSGVIAMLIPYGAEIYPVSVRSTGTGLVAGSSKLGGIVGVGVGLAALAPGLSMAAVIVAIPVMLSALVLARRSIETRGRGLEDIAPRPPALPQTDE